MRSKGAPSRKVCKASKARKFIFAFLSRVAICLQNERRDVRPLFLKFIRLDPTNGVKAFGSQLCLR